MITQEPPAQKALLGKQWIEADKEPPRFGQYVFYRTAEYQALGCYDRPGIWRFSDGELESNTVRMWRPVN